LADHYRRTAQRVERMMTRPGQQAHPAGEPIAGSVD